MLDLILTREGYEKIMDAHNKLVQLLHDEKTDQAATYHEFMMVVMTVLREDVYLEAAKEYAL